MSLTIWQVLRRSVVTFDSSEPRRLVAPPAENKSTASHTPSTSTGQIGAMVVIEMRSYRGKSGTELKYD